VGINSERLGKVQGWEGISNKLVQAPVSNCERYCTIAAW
jgi:hypothetical protein